MPMTRCGRTKCVCLGTAPSPGVSADEGGPRHARHLKVYYDAGGPHYYYAPSLMAAHMEVIVAAAVAADEAWGRHSASHADFGMAAGNYQTTAMVWTLGQNHFQRQVLMTRNLGTVD